MRAHYLAFSFAACLIASNASAQPQPAAPSLKTFMSSKEIIDLIAKAKAERKGDFPVVLEPILSLAPYRAQLEYRPGITPASIHEKDAELMVVLQGTGNAVIGGTLVEEKRNNANNLSGTSIAGGETKAIGAGDVFIIPAGTAHQILPTGGAPIVIMSMHVPYPPANWPPAN